MRLSRAHGLGNDYLIADGPLSAALVVALCDRHRGVGSDGVLEPIPGREGAAFGLRIHNPDGSEAEKSGNGLRIFAHWLHHRRGAPATFSVWTAGGIVECLVDGDVVTVDMGLACVFAPREYAGVVATPVSVGNPHAVVFGDDVPADWRTLGARMENSVAGRTNVQFAVMRAGVAHARIWERGAGETLSSGSSACAVAVVAVASGRAGSPVTVSMPGGELTIDVGEPEPAGAPGRSAGDAPAASSSGATFRAPLRMRGPVERVAEVTVDASWLQARS